MATLIPEYNWTDFLKVAKLRQLHRLKSCEINYNGVYQGTWVNGNLEKTGYVRTQVEYNAQSGNSVGGETLEDILIEETVPA